VCVCVCVCMYVCIYIEREIGRHTITTAERDWLGFRERVRHTIPTSEKEQVLSTNRQQKMCASTHIHKERARERARARSRFKSLTRYDDYA
jgi:hypothetical protein